MRPPTPHLPHPPHRSQPPQPLQPPPFTIVTRQSSSIPESYAPRFLYAGECTPVVLLIQPFLATSTSGLAKSLDHPSQPTNKPPVWLDHLGESVTHAFSQDAELMPDVIHHSVCRHSTRIITITLLAAVDRIRNRQDMVLRRSLRWIGSTPRRHQLQIIPCHCYQRTHIINPQ